MSDANSSYRPASRSIAVVTGASSGLGRAFARTLAALDYDLVLIARNTLALKELKEKLKCSFNINVHVVSLDLTRDTACEELFGFLKANALHPQLFINNAGLGCVGEALNLEDHAQEAMIDLNVKALTRLSLAASRMMKENGGGKILNVASIAAFCPTPNLAVYGATKAYVLAFSENLALEVAPYNITVTALCPGPVQTPFWEKAGLKDTRRFNAAMIDEAQVVTDSLNALFKGLLTVTPSWRYKALYAATKFFPRALTRSIARFIIKRAI